MRYSRGLAAVISIGLLAVPGTAMAGTRTKSASFSGKGATKTVTAVCPSGQRATGGGFRVTRGVIAPTIVITHVYESRKIGQRKWRVSAQLQDGGAPDATVRVTSYVYCNSSAPETKEKVKGINVTAGVNNSVPLAVKCGSGKRARAGGFSMSPPVSGGAFRHVVLDSYRVSKSKWRSRFAKNAGAGTARFASYTYCAAGGTQAKVGHHASTGDNTTATALTGICGSGTSMVAGGFSQTSDSTSRRIIWQSRRIKTKLWIASGLLSQSVSAPQTLYARGYCK